MDEENVSANGDISKSCRKVIHRNEEKWWLPIPCVPAVGLPEKTRKELQQKKDCANQIHKAAMAINNSILTEMEIPETYMATLPKVQLVASLNTENLLMISQLIGLF